jgi:hypothetical protein
LAPEGVPWENQHPLTCGILKRQIIGRRAWSDADQAASCASTAAAGTCSQAHDDKSDIKEIGWLKEVMMVFIAMKRERQ